MAKFTAVRIASAVTLPEAVGVTFSVTKFAAVTTIASAVKLPSPDFGLISDRSCYIVTENEKILYFNILFRVV